MNYHRFNNCHLINTLQINMINNQQRYFHCMSNKYYHKIYKQIHFNEIKLDKLHIHYQSLHYIISKNYHKLNKYFHSNKIYHYKMYKYFQHCKFYKLSHINHKYKIHFKAKHNNLRDNLLSINYCINNGKQNKLYKLCQKNKLNILMYIFHINKHILIFNNILQDTHLSKLS